MAASCKLGGLLSVKHLCGGPATGKASDLGLRFRSLERPPVTSSQERRSHPRRTIEGVHVHNGVVSGKLLNFSARGLAIETTSSLRVGALYTLRLGRPWMSFRVTGIVRWSRLARTQRLPDGEVSPVFVTGIAIESAGGE